jgi:hypothetical protein
VVLPARASVTQPRLERRERAVAPAAFHNQEATLKLSDGEGLILLLSADIQTKLGAENKVRDDMTRPGC